MNSLSSRSVLAAALFLAASVSIHAEVKLPAIFGDHMVLQEGAKLPVWGTADPGESITVTAGRESAQATADKMGKWRADLAPLPANAAPITVTVAGKTNTVTFSDVLVGEIWICSGQSNMEFNLGGGSYGFGGAHNADTVLPQANNPQLRLFLVAKKTSLDPVDDVAGKWELCTPAAAGKFSAVGYFFGRDLRQDLKKPVGLIGTYWGGTPAQAWTSLSGLQKEPRLKGYVEAEEQSRVNFASASAEYPAKKAAFQTAMTEWKEKDAPVFNEKIKAWNEAVKQAVAANQPLPLRPSPDVAQPRAPIAPDGGPNGPTTLFNGMVAPLIPFAVKGAIWYQGESNAGRAQEYGTLFPDMITDWREKWGEGNFPFLFVQLAGYDSGRVVNWPYLREAQLKTLSLPETGMATAIDIGVPNNIHPQDKDDVGRRLELAARHIAYGEKLVYSGPIYKAMTAKGDAVSLTFTHDGSGLVIGKAPWVAAGFKPLPDDKLLGFTIAGDDKKWVPADAKIEGNTVVVSSAQVPKPVAVRYDWANDPQGNLYNKEGLPASSFRTDDWLDPVAEGVSSTPAPAPKK